MNKSYISVWSEATGTWVAAPEFASARGKRSKARVVAGVAVASILGCLGMAGNARAASVSFATGGATANAVAATPPSTTVWNNGALTPLMGIYATGIGSNARADAGGTALGDTAVTVGYGGVALGAYSMATSDWATAVGTGAIASGSYSAAFGANALAGGLRSTAIGYGARSGGQDSLALGNRASGGGQDSIALGRVSSAGGQNSIAIGGGTPGTGNDSSSSYSGASAAGQDSIAVGRASLAGGQNSIAIGGSGSGQGSTPGLASWASGEDGIALGRGAQSSDTRNIALGALSHAGFADGGVVNAPVSTGGNTLNGKYYAYAGAVADSTVSVGNGLTGLYRTVTNVAAGRVSAASTDAINGSQLYAAYQAFGVSVGGGTGSGLADAVMYDDATHSSVTLGGLGATTSVNLTNVAQGALSATSTDAVNGAQLYATNQQVASNTTNITSLGDTVNAINTNGARYFHANSTDTDSVASGSQSVAIGPNAIASGAYAVAEGNRASASGTHSIALGSSSAASKDFALAMGQNAQANGQQATALGQGATVTADSSTAVGTSARATGARSIAAGSFSSASGQNSAAFGDFATAQGGLSTALGNASNATGDYATAVGNGAAAGAQFATAIGNASSVSAMGGVAIGSGASASQDNSVAIGRRSTTLADLTQSAYNPNASASIAGMTPFGEFSVGAAGSERRITNVAAGAASTDAVNVSQLQSEAEKSNHIGKSTAEALGGGATYQADGTISAPGYNVGGTTFNNVGGALTNLDGRVTTNASDITNLQGQMADAVTYDSPEHNSVTLGGADAGTPVGLHNVAAGAVSASSTDAINGGQLYGTAASTAAALGGGATVNADGTISAPSYSVGGTTVHNVGDAVTNLDGRVTQNTNDITNVQNLISNGTIGLVQQDPATGNITVGASTGGLLVNMAGMSGNRVVTGVADGVSTYDAVNFGQLSALQTQVTGLGSQVSNLQVSNLQGGSPYFNATDTSSSDSSDGAVVNAALPGEGAGSTAAGSGAAASGKHATVIGANSSAAADNAVAVGANSAATGVNSTAIGAGSQATHGNSIALGQGSVTDRDNSVSVGSITQQRQITNVAAGTADTDAVNVGQLNSSVSQGVAQANSYSDQLFNQSNQAIDKVARNAYAGIAAAMAMPNMTPSGPGRTIVAAGGATYKGGSATAVGATYRSRNGKWLAHAAASVTSTGDAGVRAHVGYEF